MKHRTRIIALVLFVIVAAFWNFVWAPRLQGKSQLPATVSASVPVLYSSPITPLRRRAEMTPLTFYRPIRGLGPTPLIPSVINLYPVEKDVTWGKEWIEGIKDELIDDAPLTSYLEDKLAELIAVKSDYPALFTPHVYLYRDPEAHNAYAGGGGYMKISLEVIAHAENEEVLILTLAHELGHNALRHGTGCDTFRRMMAAQESAIQAQMGLTEVKKDAEKFKLLVFAIERMQRNYDDDLRLQLQMDEMSADVYGIQALYRAGYDARKAVADYWRKSKSESPENEYYDRHPNYAARALRIELEVDELAKVTAKERIANPALFAAVQARAKALIDGKELPPLPSADPPVAPR